MESLQLNSLSNSSSSDLNHSSSSISNSIHNHHHSQPATNDPMHSWWESVSKARSRIDALLSLLDLPPSGSDSETFSSVSLFSLADSDRPARSLLESIHAYSAVAASLSSPHAGSGNDPLCQWLYDTYLSSDSDLRLVVLSFVPVLAGLYLSRLHSSSTTDASGPSLAGYEAVLLAFYASETKLRAGKPLLVSIPDLSQPSLYHNPRALSTTISPLQSSPIFQLSSQPAVGVLSAPLEPQLAVKSTKRGCIVGVALDCYYKQISQMPRWSKVELCHLATVWAGDDCPCAGSLDGADEDDDDASVSCELEGGVVRISNGSTNELHKAVDEMDMMGSDQNRVALSAGGARIPLPWELLQPVLRILGHCLLGPLNTDEIKDAAAAAVRRLYARASHDLNPQAILATRSLVQLDNRARTAAKAGAASVVVDPCSTATTPSKAKKPEILLVSK